MDREMVYVEALQVNTKIHLVVIPTEEDALIDLETFSFIASCIFTVGIYHSLAVTEILHLIERLKDIHTKM